MKIAVATDDLQTVGIHFGQTKNYLVYTVENGIVTGQETRPKIRRTISRNRRYTLMSTMASIIDCDVVLVGGMTRNNYDALIVRSIQPIIIDIQDIELALKSYLSGKIVNHLERLY